ncbi:hypothetical protein GCM10027053_29190 [Intrasporangium mesophilum]
MDLGTRMGGGVLATTLGAATGGQRKTLHAWGRTYLGAVRIDAPMPDLAIPLVEDRGVHRCTVRFSRALSTPAGWWDIGGVAVRIPEAGCSGGPADLWFTTTGAGRVSRHVPRPTRRPSTGPLTTMLPTRAAAGCSVALMVAPMTEGEPPREYELSISVGGSPWFPIGLLHIQHEVPDEPTRYDPVVDELDGTTVPPWVVALREPGHLWARRHTSPPT